MPEFRRDFLLDRWVVIAPERAHRPLPPMPPVEVDDPRACPFCPGHEGETPREVMALGRSGSPPDTPGWSVRVVPNRFPALVPAPPVPSSRGGALIRPGHGVHEVVVESPDHGARWHQMEAAQRAQVVEATTKRFETIASLPGIRSVLVFRNEGRAAGATLSHPHLQVLGLAGDIPLVAAEAEAARARYQVEGACPWCRLIEIELEDGARVVEAGPLAVTLAPIAPRFPYETWVLPRDHAAGFPQSPARVREAVGEALARLVSRLKAGVGDVAYNWFLHSLPSADSGPHFHWHVEVLPRTVHAAGFEWGSGMHLHPVEPEVAAARLRAATG